MGRSHTAIPEHISSTTPSALLPTRDRSSELKQFRLVLSVFTIQLTGIVSFGLVTVANKDWVAEYRAKKHRNTEKVWRPHPCSRQTFSDA